MLYSDYEERIDSIQGNYIVSGDRIFENLTSKVDLVLSPGVIRIGDKTTLWGWFYTPCEYIGMLENRAIFYLGGGGSDLFNKSAYYYDVTYIFGPDRIGKAYRPGTFRDCLWKNNKWK